jgi:hypothetical protein
VLESAKTTASAMVAIFMDVSSVVFRNEIAKAVLCSYLLSANQTTFFLRGAFLTNFSWEILTPSGKVQILSVLYFGYSDVSGRQREEW